MSVYVDDFNAPYRGMKMCHMMADTTDELLDMVHKIGVQAKWIQYAGDPVNEHFDISLTKKKLALEHGAIEVSARELAEARHNKGENLPLFPDGYSGVYKNKDLFNN